MIKKCFMLVAYMCFSCTAMAVDIGDKRNMFAAAVSFGGDDLGDGLSGGGDISLLYGRTFPLNHGVQFQLNAGIKNDYVAASNGDIWFYRFPLEALFFKKFDRYRFGAGPVYHLKPKYEATLSNGSSVIDFRSAVGLAFQADQFLSSRLSTGLRLEYITYTPKQFIYNTQTNVVMHSVNGSSLGVFIRYHF
ncbi:hypothetical protein ACFL2V_04650 [Pseudomonadota bacterium]